MSSTCILGFASCMLGKGQQRVSIIQRARYKLTCLDEWQAAATTSSLSFMHSYLEKDQYSPHHARRQNHTSTAA